MKGYCYRDSIREDPLSRFIGEKRRDEGMTVRPGIFEGCLIALKLVTRLRSRWIARWMINGTEKREREGNIEEFQPRRPFSSLFQIYFIFQNLHEKNNFQISPNFRSILKKKRHLVHRKRFSDYFYEFSTRRWPAMETARRGCVTACRSPTRHKEMGRPSFKPCACCLNKCPFPRDASKSNTVASGSHRACNRCYLRAQSPISRGEAPPINRVRRFPFSRNKSLLRIQRD